MTTVPIPNWTPGGVLPPFNPISPTGVDRSPYPVSLTELTLRFNISLERQAILKGFLDFRSALHHAGLVVGFQWLDGSFLEDVETVERRPPRDLDVVTFYELPQGQTQQALGVSHPSLFSSAKTKNLYRVDAYFVQLDPASLRQLAHRAAYWYSLWSHRRNEVWKGYLEVDLSPAQDLVARTNAGYDPTGGGRQ